MQKQKLLLGLWGAALLAAPTARGMTAPELVQARQDGLSLRLIDVRPSARFRKGSIPGAMSVPAAVLLEKNLSLHGRIVLFSDGFGDVDLARYLEALNQRQDVQAEELEGGYAAWLDDRQATTARTGVQLAEMRMISYKKLETLTQAVIMVDLRSGKAAKGVKPPPDRLAATGNEAQSPRATTTSRNGDKIPAAGTTKPPIVPDALKEFCKAPTREYCRDLADLRKRFKKKPVLRSQAAPASRATHEPTPLIVLVDDDFVTAIEQGRRLRVSGYHRVAVLTGGELALQTKGKSGLGRVGGKLFGGSFSPQEPQPKESK